MKRRRVTVFTGCFHVRVGRLARVPALRACVPKVERYVTVTVTDDLATFQVVDPCCHVRNCRQLRAITFSAYCGWADLVGVVSPPLDDIDTTVGGCCDCPLVNGPADYYIEQGTLTMGIDRTGAFAGVPGGQRNLTLTVDAPFTYVA